MARKGARFLWVPFVGFITWLLAVVVQAIWGVITERYVGSPIVNGIENFLKNIPSLIDWIISHPFEASAIWFFISLSIVLFLVYRETRDPNGLSAGKALFNSVEKADGVRVINDTGYNLFNCVIRLEKIDEVVLKDDLRWGYVQQEYVTEIREGQGASFRLQQISHIVQKVIGESPYSENIEAEFAFRCNNETTHKVLLLPIYVTFKLQEMTSEKNTFYVPMITRIET